MRPSEKFEAKTAQVSPCRYAEMSKACPACPERATRVEGSMAEWVEGAGIQALSININAIFSSIFNCNWYNYLHLTGTAIIWYNKYQSA